MIYIYKTPTRIYIQIISLLIIACILVMNWRLGSIIAGIVSLILILPLILLIILICVKLIQKMIRLLFIAYCSFGSIMKYNISSYKISNISSIEIFQNKKNNKIKKLLIREEHPKYTNILVPNNLEDLVNKLTEINPSIKIIEKGYSSISSI